MNCVKNKNSITKSGLILKVSSDKTLVMTDKFDFVELKSKPGMSRGQKVDFGYRDLYRDTHPSKLGKLKLVNSLTSIAAVLLLVFSFGMNFFLFPREYAYIDIDINPSLELIIDNEKNVIKTKALNTDAQTIIDETESKGLPIYNALTNILENSKKKGYLDSNDSTILFSASINSKHSKEPTATENIEVLLDSCKLAAEVLGIDSKTVISDPVSRNTAHQKGLSMGRYAAYNEAKNKGIDIEIEEVKSGNISSILSIIEYDMTGSPDGSIISKAPFIPDNTPIPPYATVTPVKDPPLWVTPGVITDGTSLNPTPTSDNSSLKRPTGTGNAASHTTPPAKTPSTIPTITPIRTPAVTSAIAPTKTPAATSSITPTKTPAATPAITPTKTPAATPAITPTKTAKPSPTQTPTETIKFELQAYNHIRAAETKEIQPRIMLVNKGNMTINLHDVKIRYYYTKDQVINEAFTCDWSNIPPSKINGRIVEMASVKTNADSYVEIGFAPDAGFLKPNQRVEIVSRIGNSYALKSITPPYEEWNYMYNQISDYSFNAASSGFVRSYKITVYLSGDLYWGIEP